MEKYACETNQMLDSSSSMDLQTLVDADFCRDGGSYEACFLRDGGSDYHLWLQRSSMPDAEGRHHRWLFEYQAPVRPQNCVPIVTGSVEEYRIVQSVRSFLAQPSPNLSPAPWLRQDHRLERLAEMLRYILRREPCFPSDLRTAGFIA